MADNWLQVVLRIPVILLLDFSITFLPAYLDYTNAWFMSGCIQVTCKYCYYIKFGLCWKTMKFSGINSFIDRNVLWKFQVISIIKTEDNI